MSPKVIASVGQAVWQAVLIWPSAIGVPDFVRYISFFFESMLRNMRLDARARNLVLPQLGVRKFGVCFNLAGFSARHARPQSLKMIFKNPTKIPSKTKS